MPVKKHSLAERQARAVEELIDAFSLRHETRSFLPYRFPKSLRRSPMAPVATPEELAAARKSVFFWWWRFLKASPEYPPLGTNKRQSAIAETYRHFGELGDDFATWWQRTGRELFSEPYGSPVRVLWDSGGGGYDTIPRMLIMEVSLDVPFKEVVEDLTSTIQEVHARNELEWWEQRSSRFAPYPKRIVQTRSFEAVLEVWEKALEQNNRDGRKENLEWTRLAKAVGMTGGSPAATATRMTKLYRRAQRLVHHVARGEFPRED